MNMPARKHRKKTTTQQLKCGLGYKPGYTLVRSLVNDDSFKSLNEHTKKVHVIGPLFLWALEEIVKLAPNVEVIHVAKSALEQAESQKQFCKKHQIKLEGGTILAQDIFTNRAPSRNSTFKKQKAFLEGLKDERKAAFDELLALNFIEAQMACKFFGLRGETPTKQAELKLIFGYKRITSISTQINAVLVYLNAGDECYVSTNPQTRTIAKGMQRKVQSYHRKQEKIRRQSAPFDHLKEVYGLKCIPEGLPRKKCHHYELVLEAKKTGVLGRLKRVHPTLFHVISTRYDLKSKQPIYRQLRDMAEGADCSRQWISIQENQAYKWLQDHL